MLLTVRDDMVERQIEARGVENPVVLRAMREVPREAFVPTGATDGLNTRRMTGL